MEVLAPPGQSTVATAAYRTDRGMLESYLEGKTLSSFAASQTPSGNVSVQVPVSATDIVFAAQQQGIARTVITAANLGELDGLNISADAKARITQEVQNGDVVDVPVQAVTIGGVASIGWLDIQSDGTLTGVLENGDHGGQLDAEFAAVEVAQTLVDAAAEDFFAFFTGFFAGWAVGQIINFAGLLFFAAEGGCPYTNLRGCYKFSPTVQEALALSFTSELATIARQIAVKACLAFFVPGASGYCLAGFTLGLSAATNGFTIAGAFSTLMGDPPISPMLIVGSQAPAASPGSHGVTVSISPDPNFTLPIGSEPVFQDDEQIPTVFDLLVTNTGSAADTFNISLANPPAGFALVGSLPAVQIPAGTQAEIGVCAIPTGTLPAPGTMGSFNATATSATNPSITATGTEALTVPSIARVTITQTGSPAAVSAGNSAQVTLQIEGIGNTPTAATLSGASDPNLTVGIPQTSVTVNPGQTMTEALTLTAPESVPVGATLNSTVSAAFGSGNPQQTSTAALALTVEAQQALAAGNAAPSATAAGRPDIAATLSGLSSAITSLIANCNSTTLAEFQNYAGNLIQQANSNFFVSANVYPSGTYALTQELQNTTCSNYTTTVTDLNTVIANLNNLLSSPAAFPFSLGLAPASVVAQPNSSSTIKSPCRTSHRCPRHTTSPSPESQRTRRSQHQQRHSGASAIDSGR